ncbi:MAG: hypothetical protein F6K41_05280 [Symploca sp. SIO3E6]|nr:hypothetical protein [Caldora sp. SIO3E6]
MSTPDLVNPKFDLASNGVVEVNSQLQAYGKDGRLITAQQIEERRFVEIKFLKGGTFLKFFQTNELQSFEIVPWVNPFNLASSTAIVVTRTRAHSTGETVNLFNGEEVFMKVAASHENKLTIPPNANVYIAAAMTIHNCVAIATQVFIDKVESIFPQPQTLTAAEIEEQKTILKQMKYAPAEHAHRISQVEGLESDLSSIRGVLKDKSNTGHAHQLGDVEGLADSLLSISRQLANIAQEVAGSNEHQHEQGDVEGLTEAFTDINQRLTGFAEEIAKKATVASLESALESKAPKDLTPEFRARGINPLETHAYGSISLRDRGTWNGVAFEQKFNPEISEQVLMVNFTPEGNPDYYPSYQGFWERLRNGSGRWDWYAKDGVLFASGFNQISASSTKKDFQAIPPVSEKLSQIPIFSYVRKRDGVNAIGVKAESMAELFPSTTNEMTDPTGQNPPVLTVDFAQGTSLLLKGWQENHSEILNLKARLGAVEKRFNALES